ncbi:MAG: universal stress protein [Alphaproteobacteria bacterium]|nr:universal stress protein [Alphaproteobacteria bacterium]
MSLKDILVCLDASDAGTERLRVAIQLAREHQAHLAAVYVLPQETDSGTLYPPTVAGLGIAAPAGATDLAPGALVAGVPEPGVAPALPRGVALAEIIEQRFREGLHPHGLHGDWHPLAESDGAELLMMARTADLVVIGQVAPELRVPSGFRPEDIVELCGRPLLVVPYAGSFPSLGRRVLVAWDGTREASRALHDALPLMAGAEAVTVLTVRTQQGDLDRGDPSLDRAVRHLERHGLAARAEETVRGDIAISDVLLSRAADLGADLIVAGAYHHSRLREALFGGVSRELLQHMTLPLLTSH